MCIAIPAQITEIDHEKNMAKATVSGNTLNVNVCMVKAKVGDYVLVHAGCAVETLRPERAEEILALLAELEP